MCSSWSVTSGSTLSAAGTAITLVGFFSSFYGGGKTYGDVTFTLGTTETAIDGSNTFSRILTTGAGALIFVFTPGNTTTLTGANPLPSGSAGNVITLRADTAWNLVKTSGSVTPDYVNISYSQASGGATFTAGVNSTNGGNNTGWTFTPAAPVAAFSMTPLSGTSPLSSVATESSTNTPTAWTWTKRISGGAYVDFADKNAQNPTEVFTEGTWDVKLLASNAGGSDEEEKLAYVVVSAASTGPDFSAVAPVNRSLHHGTIPVIGRRPD